MLLPFILVQPPALIAQFPEHLTGVNTQGQVRNSFVIYLADGGSLSFTQGQHIWVKSRIMQGSNQVGWLCESHGKTFRVALENVQI